jgi:hypothetical protein
MKRRVFISVLGKGSILMGMSYPLFSCAKKKLTLSKWEPEDLAAICSKEQLLELGNEYRELSGENNRDTIIGLITKNFSGNLEDQKKYLSALVSDDFRTNQTVLLNGWLLSRTEARQCALLTLSSE